MPPTRGPESSGSGPVWPSAGGPAVPASVGSGRRLGGTALRRPPLRPPIPRPDEVPEVAPGSLRGLHRRRVTPDGGVLVVVGDLTPGRALDQVEKPLGGWESTARKDPVPRVPAVETGPLLLVDRPGSVQSNLRFGGDAPDLSDPSYAAVQLADAIFTGLFSSRLTANLREDKGYTYGSYSTIRHQRGGSSLAVGVDVATDVTAPAMVETLYELGRIVTLPPQPDEVDATVQYLTGTAALGTATQSGLADTLIHLLMRGLDVSWLRDHPAQAGRGRRRPGPRGGAALLAHHRLVWTVLGDADLLQAPLATVTEVTTLAGA